MKIDEKQQHLIQEGCRHVWWRSPWIGYPSAVLFAAAAFMIPLTERLLGIRDEFIEPPFVIATLLIGGIWGIGPALLALVLEVLALDYWIVPSVGVIDFFLWPNIASFAPFILIQLIVLGMVIIQKNYRQQILQASQSVSRQAEELAESNKRLQKADQLKDQFLAMASHELKTPVTSIQAHVQLLLRRLKRPEMQENSQWQPVHDSLISVDEQIHRLTGMVNDLLDINSLRSGKIPLHLEPCDLGEVCQQVIDHQHSREGHTLDLHMPTDPVIVQADRGRISEVVSNLIINALKYSPAQTPIRVEVGQSPQEAVLTVSNQGPPLSREQQETLFEPFYRSPEARASGKPGWGLGLAICKEIVQQHRGSIRVESSEEAGTTLTVSLPR